MGGRKPWARDGGRLKGIIAVIITTGLGRGRGLGRGLGRIRVGSRRVSTGREPPATGAAQQRFCPRRPAFCRFGQPEVIGGT